MQIQINTDNNIEPLGKAIDDVAIRFGGPLRALGQLQGRN